MEVVAEGVVGFDSIQKRTVYVEIFEDLKMIYSDLIGIWRCLQLE
jgi:hypothetical protein